MDKEMHAERPFIMLLKEPNLCNSLAMLINLKKLFHALNLSEISTFATRERVHSICKSFIIFNLFLFIMK